MKSSLGAGHAYLRVSLYPRENFVFMKVLITISVHCLKEIILMNLTHFHVQSQTNSLRDFIYKFIRYLLLCVLYLKTHN